MEINGNKMPAGTMSLLIAARQSDAASKAALRNTAYTAIREVLVAIDGYCPRSRAGAILRLSQHARGISPGWYAYHGITVEPA